MKKIRLCGVTPAPIKGRAYGTWDWSGKPACMTFDRCHRTKRGGALELVKGGKRYTVEGTVISQVSPTGMPIAVLNTDPNVICGKRR